MLTTKTASLTDAPQILALQKRAYQSEALIYNDWTLPPLIQTIESLNDELVQSVCLTVWSNEVLIGSIRARQMDGIAQIGRLIVHPDYQKRGIGTQLLHAIEQHFYNANTYELFTGSLSQSNIRLYQGNGYTYTHKQQLSDDLVLIYLSKHNQKKKDQA